MMVEHPHILSPGPLVGLGVVLQIVSKQLLGRHLAANVGPFACRILTAGDPAIQRLNLSACSIQRDLEERANVDTLGTAMHFSIETELLAAKGVHLQLQVTLDGIVVVNPAFSRQRQSLQLILGEAEFPWLIFRRVYRGSTFGVRFGIL